MKELYKAYRQLQRFLNRFATSLGHTQPSGWIETFAQSPKNR